ncbi:MAG: 6-carboxytetrahydropterin synthase [Acidobacteria bacterium]|nr:6-carboxytetrahydropterin synthase [Acidobacteriota bacterium]
MSGLRTIARVLRPASRAYAMPCGGSPVRLLGPATKNRSVLEGCVGDLQSARGSPALECSMYSVTKRIDFCYGHRLLDYDGICKHPHGHNATAEIEVRTDLLDSRNMVCDFSDIKRIVKGWVDRELDHKMVLRHDDPLVAPLQQLGEPIFIVDSNPTVERIARLIFDHARQEGLAVVRVTVWETPTSWATYGEPVEQ